MPVWDEAQRGVWRLEVSGLVDRPMRLTLDELKALPRSEARLEHFCVEGWSAIAVRTGVRLSDLARHVGLSPDARYVDFQSFDDDYHESWDIESALHPQTLVVYGQDGELLEPRIRRAGAHLFAGEARATSARSTSPGSRFSPNATAATGATWATSGTAASERSTLRRRDVADVNRRRLPDAAPRLGRRTALTFPLPPPPQKN